MALLGAGVLAIWNGIEAGMDDDFVEWHVLEHIPERVGVPGFLRGRRYVATDGHPLYFNFYETADPGVLTSPAYRQRLDAPSEWTRRNIARFRDTCRTICSVAASLGRGEGAWVETVRLTAECEPEAFRGSLAGSVLPGVLARTGVIGVHLLQGETAASQGGSAEKKLRSQPDQIADWVILIEAIEADALRSARQDAASDAALRRAGAGSSINRGTYRLQFGLTKAELERGSTAPEHWSRGA
ncbi:MAG: hypothetical protein KJZ80_09810 [Hyphomicrobiaceae bacterium]|nr:hypothetical protein [Hyphomicrobiaceae bacterium]